MKGLIICFVLLLPHPIPAQNMDISLLRKINLPDKSALDPSFRFISNSVAPITIAVPVGFIAAWLVKKNASTRRKAIITSSAVAFSTIISTSLKYTVNRSRPFVTYPDIKKKASANGPSFPSNHTSFAFCVATSVSLCYPKWYIIAPCYLWASSVGYSRLALGVHYPSDALAGAIIGSGSAFLSYQLNKWLLARRSSGQAKKTDAIMNSQ